MEVVDKKFERPQFIHPAWKEILELNNVKSFGDLWDLKVAPSAILPVKTGGTVSKLWLKRADSSLVAVFLKRREEPLPSFLTRWRKPTSSLERECANLEMLRKLEFETPEVITFHQEVSAGKIRSILLTQDLSHYISLGNLLSAWRRPGLLDGARRKLIIDALATELRRMHDASLSHNDLSPDHIFVRFEDIETATDVPERIRAKCGFVDLEGVRKSILASQARTRDLTLMHQRTSPLSKSERLRFVKGYLGASRITPKDRKFIRKVIASK